MMEASSPLAAMQPPSLTSPFGFRKDAPSCASFAMNTSFGPNSFNFKDLSMKGPSSDYFNMQPIRGSSPTASLAADLSQNFHIDQSPQLPTPRRALFGANFYVGAAVKGAITTPPILSSSPGPHSDSMDMSPLPHKAPHNMVFEMALQSPTPDVTPTESSMLSVPTPIPDTSNEIITLTQPHERRKSNPVRPLLSRHKGFSTNSLPQKPNPESQLPRFRFGGGLNKPVASSTLSLSEAFAESPPQDKSVPRGGPVIGPPRPRIPFCLGNNARTGSPSSNHARKGSNLMVRPRKQFRRSLSMFEHPEDVINQEKSAEAAPSLSPIMDVETAHILQLPHFSTADEVGSLPRITKETMVEVLDGKFNNVYEKLVIIDCRFEYEYQGGHIDGAVNFNDKEQLATHLFELEPTSRALLIFHCEYSAHRAPIMAKFIRNKDRTVNAERYPTLTYPESYILDGGYSSFFKDYQSRCFPQNYVEMGAEEHAVACERGLGKVKQRSKLVRAQTFAFGQQSSPSMDSSPTTYCKGRLMATDMDMDTCMNLNPMSNHVSVRFPARRMGSY